MYNCAINGRFSSAWTISAASTVLMTRIMSVYPPVNGLTDITVPILNTTFVPTKEHPRTAPICLMWSGALTPSSRTWTPNHFVPLLLREEPATVDLSSSPKNPTNPDKASTPKKQDMSKPVPVQHADIPCSPIGISSAKIDKSPTSQLPIPDKSPSDSLFSNDQTDRSSSLFSDDKTASLNSLSDPLSKDDGDISMSTPHSRSSTKRQNRPRSISSPLLSDAETGTPSSVSPNQDNSSSPPSQPSSDHQHEVNVGLPGAIPILDRKFLNPEDVFRLMLSEPPSGKTVPRGIKENVLFVLDNEENGSRQTSGDRASYTDDCGAWSGKASCKTHHYILTEENNLHYVDKKEGQYVKYSKGKRVPIKPQPVNNIIVFKRYYISLKRDTSYKKRISTVIECPSELNGIKNIAVAEYIGTFPENVPHGNSKKITGDYVRSSSAVKRKLEGMIQAHKYPREIYEEMVLEDDSVSAPRDLKQVQNAKYNIEKKKKIKTENGYKYRNNQADEIQILLSDIHEHPFIQEIIQMKGKPPCVVLYLDDNLKDIQQFCTPSAQHPSVLGIDRTFNLGACFATTVVYQHRNLTRKGTCNPPIMLGAIYLHWDGLYTTYHRFFSHLQSKLDTMIGGTQLSKIVIGSDEEAALTKAVKQCFPSSVNVLCTRHLEENVRRCLSNKIGVSDQTRRRVLKDIFGKNGLTCCNDVKTFELRKMELSDKYSAHLPAFKEHFEKYAERITKGVFQPRIENRWLPINWKNNYCESMNHIIKLTAHWKTMKLPDLVDRLYKIVKLQQADCRRALYGQGNYELAPWVSKFQVPFTRWSQKTEEEKATLFANFMKGLPPKKTTISSTDGCLTVPKTPKTARKPGQRKRTKNTKTYTRARTNAK